MEVVGWQNEKEHHSDVWYLQEGPKWSVARSPKLRFLLFTQTWKWQEFQLFRMSEQYNPGGDEPRLSAYCRWTGYEDALP